MDEWKGWLNCCWNLFKSFVLNISVKYFQDPIQFLADYLLKNNKREDSDREETDDGKTDSWEQWWGGPSLH